LQASNRQAAHVETFRPKVDFKTKQGKGRFMTRHKIAILVGSLRKGSLNRRIGTSICKLAGNVLDCEVVEIGNLPLYDQDSDSNPPPQYVEFRQKLAAVDGVLFVSPEYNRGIPGVLKNAIDVGSRPYGQSVFDKKPAAIVTASPGSIGGFGANHQIRQSCVFLNMPVMQQPEAYLGQVTDDNFDQSGCIKPGPLRDLIVGLAEAFGAWVDMIHRSRRLLAEDTAHAAKQNQKEHA
jgi:chromate reductase